MRRGVRQTRAQIVLLRGKHRRGLFGRHARAPLLLERGPYLGQVPFEPRYGFKAQLRLRELGARGLGGRPFARGLVARRGEIRLQLCGPTFGRSLLDAERVELPGLRLERLDLPLILGAAAVTA